MFRPSRRWAFLVVAAGMTLTGCSSAGARGPHGPIVTFLTRPRATAPVPGATTVPPAGSTKSPGSPAPAPDAADPCPGTTAPADYQHVVVIVMENRGADQLYGSSDAPYEDRLASACGTATDYSGVAHPSLPNYLALTSGSTHGVSDDAGPATHPLGGQSIFGLLGSGRPGTGWRSLEESMPVPCDHAGGGGYAVKHNPAAYYTALAGDCPARDVPMDDAAPDVSARYTIVTPNLCDDGHDCSTATADRWLAREMPLVLDSPEYRSGTTVVFLTWDESDYSGTQVPMYVIAPSVPAGTRVSTAFDHYSLLRTAEELLGLSPLLGRAATATSMRAAFRL